MPLPVSLLNLNAAIHRSIGEERTSTGWRDARPSIIGSAQVRIVPAGWREASIAGAQGVVVSHSIYASSSADIRRNDELEVEILPGQRKLFQVLSTEHPSVPDHYLKARVVEIQRG